MDSFPIQSTTLKFLEEVLSTLNNDRQEGLLNDRKTLDSVFSDASKKLNLVSKDLTNIRVALLSFAVIAEVDYHAHGKEGHDLSCFVMRMYCQKTYVEQIQSAKSFLKQATNNIGLGKAKSERAVELLDKVNTKATKAMNKLRNKEDDELLKVEDLVNCVKMLTMADYLMEILPDTGCPVPFKKVDSSLKKNIIVHAISHVEELLYMLEENDVSLGELILTLTNSWDRNDILADLYRGYTQWVPPILEEQEDGNVQVTLPSLTHLPLDGGVVNLKIKRPVETTLTLWIESNDRWKGWGETFLKVHLGLYGKIYSMSLSNYGLLTADTEVSVTINSKDLVAVSTDHTDKNDWITLGPEDLVDFEGRWTCEYIYALATSVASGDIKTVDELTLYLDDEKYSLHCLQKVIQTLPVTKKLYIKWASLPKQMEAHHLKEVLESAANMEAMKLDFRGMEGPVEGGCAFEMGRLVSRAKSATMDSIREYDFESFAKGFLQEIGEEGACCEEIKWEYSINYGESFKVFLDQLGWKIRCGPEDGYDEPRRLDLVIMKLEGREGQF